MVGEFAGATAHGEEAIRVAEAAEHPHSLIEAQAALGRVHLALGDLGRATALFERGLGPSRAWDIRDSSVFSGLGYAYALAGRLEEGLPLLEEAVERGLSMDAMGLGHAMRLARLGEGYLLAGRLDDARERAQAALELSRAQHERGNEAWALRLVGTIAARVDPRRLDGAAPHCRAALALAEALGMRPLAAHCHADLATLHRAATERRAAEAHLATATAMYREMGMSRWLANAEREAAGPS
jgi:tetratricopeptide (TPR) repeat protein